MTTSASISGQLRRRSVVPIESTIPPGMTIEQWRRRRSGHPVPCRSGRVARLLNFFCVAE